MKQENIEKIKEACESYLTGLRNKEIHEDSQSDYQNDIFEAAMEAFYGEDIWDEINELLD